jgi:asparagine N-glycosylation enzyme membrane subunit Stt3
VNEKTESLITGLSLGLAIAAWPAPGVWSVFLATAALALAVASIVSRRSRHRDGSKP